MFNFPIPRMEDGTCTQCSQEFRGAGEFCNECRFYQDHPQEAPGYWTWTRDANEEWKIRAKWRKEEAWPEPDTIVIVHRKDGNESQETIVEVERFHYDQAINIVLTCRVRQDGNRG